MAEEKLRILVIGAHPADVFDSAGGAMAHHSERGDHVTTLALTQGARVHDVVVSEELRKRDRMPPAEELDRLLEERTKVKQQEVRDACAIMGCTDVRFLIYTDSVLIVNTEMIEAIARLIREVRPHIVITHHPMDNGGIADQHSVTGQLVLYAINAAGSVGRGDPNPPHRVAQVFFFGISIGQFRATSLAAAEPGIFTDVLIDVTDTVERKVRALDCLKSQQYNGKYARKIVEAVEGMFGVFSGVAYAEAFIRYRPELHYYLPLGPYAVERSRELESTLRARTDILTAHTVPMEE